jgi:hypothetical protein
MSAQTSTPIGAVDEALLRRQAASLDLYGAEVALHAARQTDVDEWISAASEHLHMAVLVLEVAEADVARASAH